MSVEHFDVVIVGAGLSGIQAAYHLQRRLPGKSFTILEARDTIGGTWDLFRYPGVRSDSDMYTLGYAFRPWSAPGALAGGAAILAYIRDTARAFAIDGKVRFAHAMTAAAWSSREARWTLDIARGAERQPTRMTCNFLFACTGYYAYDEAHQPSFPGEERFAGRIVHPQFWPDDLVTKGKRIVVIGSGATAVTLVPALAEQGAAQVTMLQRSPSYVISAPTRDGVAAWLRRSLPHRAAAGALRWRSMLLGMAFYGYVRRWPAAARRRLEQRNRRDLGPDFDLKTHFTPRYEPWDQRMCLVPDADLFKALKSGQAEIVTDEIDTLTETGPQLRSGRQLAADIIVTATGLKLRLLGGVPITVDGERVNLATTTSYKGSMFSGVPNLVYSLGYTNASWTLKCELTTIYACRLLRYMDRHGLASCVPQADGSIKQQPLIDLTSGYVRRSIDALPRQGDRKPWRLNQNYVLDLMLLKFGSVADSDMRFSSRDAQGAPAATPR